MEETSFARPVVFVEADVALSVRAAKFVDKESNYFNCTNFREKQVQNECKLF